jgi:hypothetical protein
MTRLKPEQPVSVPFQVAEAIAGGLPALHGRALGLLRARKPCPVATYLLLRSEALSLDVSSDAGAAFQRRFNGYYGVRRNAVWRTAYYSLFEATKSAPADRNARFRQVLVGLHDTAGRVEASFASKLVALLDPGAPIIDSLVRKVMATYGAAPPFGGGIAEAEAYYTWLDQVISALVDHEAGTDWSQAFDVAFADTSGASAIHTAKKLDFLIWAGSAQG